MKLLALGIVSTLSLAVPVAAGASQWDIDPAHSTAEFAVKHMMVSTVKGQFGKMTGSVNLDDKDVAKSQVDITIDASTIDTREPKRDGHLKSPDFFDVAKYPTITFRSTKIAKGAKGKYKVTGDLNMHGVTRSVVLDVEGPTGPIKNMMGQMTRGVVATGKINRKDWGLNWNKPLEQAGGVLVGDEVKIEINAELIERAPAEAAAGGTPPAAPAAAEVKAETKPAKHATKPAAADDTKAETKPAKK